MGKFLLGFQALFRVWSDPAFADSIGLLLEGKPLPSPATPTPAAPVVPVPAAITPPAPQTAAPAASRSEALSLLSVLQREGRLLDFLKEPISQFTDAEIGAAVRPVHKDCAAVIERIFAVEPFSSSEEGQSIEIPANHDPSQFRVIGNAPAQGAIRGTLAHPGWKAAKCEVPTWNGRAESAMVISPAEVEV